MGPRRDLKFSDSLGPLALQKQPLAAVQKAKGGPDITKFFGRKVGFIASEVLQAGPKLTRKLPSHTCSRAVAKRRLQASLHNDHTAGVDAV